MKDKKDDCAADQVSSDKKVNCVDVMAFVSGLWTSRAAEVRLTANRFSQGPAGEADDREEENGYNSGCPSVGSIVAPGFRPWELLGRGGRGHGSATTRDRRGGQQVKLAFGVATVGG